MTLSAMVTAASPATERGVRIRFVDQVPVGAQVLREFAGPERRWAVVTQHPPEELLGAVGEGAEELCVFLASAEADALSSWRQRVAQWLAPAGMHDEPVSEVAWPQGRLLWRARRAMLEGPSAQWEELLAAFVEFAFYEGQLRALERELDAVWPTVDADIALTHRVRAADLRRWAHVNALTQQITRCRMRYARVEPRLEHNSSLFSGVGRHCWSALSARAAIARRLHELDDRLEICEGVCELANDRLSEYRYFHVECVVEIVVAILLLIEIAIMLWEVYLTVHYHG